MVFLEEEGTGFVLRVDFFTLARYLNQLRFLRKNKVDSRFREASVSSFLTVAFSVALHATPKPTRIRASPTNIKVVSFFIGLSTAQPTFRSCSFVPHLFRQFTFFETGLRLLEAKAMESWI